MELTILTVPECPNASVLEQRLAEALAGRSASIVRHIVESAEEAASRGMRGSPTLLVNGADPFADSGASPSLSCRLGEVPSVEALRQALATRPARTSG